MSAVRPASTAAALRALRKENARLADEARNARLLLENAQLAIGVGIFDTELATGERTWSPECCRLHGFPPGATPPREAVLSRVHPDDYGLVAASTAEFLRTAAAGAVAPDEFLETEYRVMLPDGTMRWISARVRVGFGPDEQPARLFGVAFDITERKRAGSALRASEERFRLATEALASFVYDWHADGDYTERIGPVELVTGFRPDEIPSSGSWWQARIHPSDLPIALAIPRAAIAGGDSVYYVEYRFQHRAGHYIDIADAARLIRDASGRVVRIVGGMRDLSEGRALQRQRDSLLESEHAARAAAEASARARDEMLAVVSHDLRNPLSTIDMCVTTLLESNQPSVEDTREILTVIKRSSNWMHRLIYDLLDVASIEAGHLALNRRDAAPAEIVATIREMFAAAALERGIDLVARADPDLPVISVDVERVLQGLANYVSNALAFTDQGGRVAIRAALAPDGVRFCVTDTGMGISPEDLAHVFDRYWQKHPGRARGTGLGLGIVRGIVDAHGGRVDVRSTAGTGSRFSFTIPTSADALSSSGNVGDSPDRSSGGGS